MGESSLDSSSNCPLAGGVVALLKLGLLVVPDELVLELVVPFELELGVPVVLELVVPVELELVWFNELGSLGGCWLVDGFDELDSLDCWFDFWLVALDEFFEPGRFEELTFVGEFVINWSCGEPLELGWFDKFTLLESALEFPFRSWALLNWIGVRDQGDAPL
jgi:hypothetical protein